MMNLYKELKRRNVFRVSIGYIITAWLLLQVVDLVLENVNAPDWVMQVFMLGLAIGFPLAVFFAWAFEMTPEGLKKEKEVDRSQSITSQTGRKLDFAIIGMLAVALGYFVWESRINTDKAERALRSTEKSVAVLPFLALSSGPDDEYFADGLTEEILNSLAQLPELLVTARTSAFHFKGQDIPPVQEIAATLGVQHIVEGSVRKSGQRLRVTAQLIRAEDGFHLWSGNYDSTSEDTIQVQEDIAEKIAQAMDVVMDDEKRAAMRSVGIRDVEAFIDFQKGLELFAKAHGDIEQIEGLRQANQYFEAALERVPGISQAYVVHSDLFMHILLNNATGLPLPGVSVQDIETAFESARADFEAAVQHAANAEERNVAELDLAIVTGNWRGLKGRFERYLNSSGCIDGNWVPLLGLTSGYVDRFLSRQHKIRTCDPLYSGSWFNESRAVLWSGDPAAAVKVAQQGLDLTDGTWLTLGLIHALVADGQFDAAQNTIDTRLQLDVDILVYSILVAAARGDGDQASVLLDEFLQDPMASDYWLLLVSAWVGDRNTSNRIAAAIDNKVIGPFALLVETNWCACGAPWDLSATPNLAAKLEQAGLPWPPASPFTLPLKNW